MLKRLKKLSVCMLIFALVFSPLNLIKAAVLEPTIELTNIYEIATAGTNLDVDVDQSSNAYVVFERSGNIYIVKNRGSEQLIGSGSNPTIAIDNTGFPHVAYISAGSVIYETFDGDWDNEVNVGVGTSASYVDIDIDSHRNAHIFMRAHHYPDNYSWTDLLYVSNVNGPFEIIKGWNGDRDFSSSGSWGGYYYDTHPISIKIDQNDNYHLLFWHASVWVWYADRDWSYSLQYHTDIPGASVNLGGNNSLYKNSLTIDALGRANVVYGAIKHGLISAGTWSETNMTTDSNPSITSNSSAIAIAYTDSGVNYYENNGSGVEQTVKIDTPGDNSAVVINDLNRFAYYIKDGKIFLATDKLIFNNPVISGVDEGGIYNTDKIVSWDHGSGFLNGAPSVSPVMVSDEGNYNIYVVNNEGKSSEVNFSIDKTAPTITINPYNLAPTNQDITVSASTDEGVLNATSHTFSENGSFKFVSIDDAGNESSQDITITNIDKTAPIIKIGIYDTNPTNQDITVSASTDEGVLNTDSYTFSANGSFDFVATDPAGNSTIYTVTIDNIDKIAPTITIDPFSTAWTNEDVVVSASTNEGVLNATSHNFSENGSFDFIATDLAGNSTTYTVTINNIDKIKPKAEIASPASGAYLRQTVFLKASSEDNESGISKVEFHSTNLGKIAEDVTAPYELSWNTTLLPDGPQEISVKAYDRAGNQIQSVPQTIYIDNSAPIITINPYNTAPTNQDITVIASTNEGTLNTTSHTFSANSSFEFIATDIAGNSTSYTVTIDNIDKIAPIITVDPYNTEPTNQDIIINASTDKGTLNTNSHTFSENGSFEFVATDALGNQAKKLIEITNIDKTPPKGAIISLADDKPLRSIIDLATNSDDDDSGIDKVEFFHASIETLIGIATSYPFRVFWDTTKVADGLHQVWSVSYDKAGNSTKSDKKDVLIDNTPPIITILPYPTENTAENITVYATINEGTINADSHTFSENGSFEFIATDEAGNKATETITISNITKPDVTVASAPVAVSADFEENSASSEDSQIIDPNTSSGAESLADPAIAEDIQKDESLTTEKDSRESKNDSVKGESTESDADYRFLYWLIPLIFVLGATIFFIVRSNKE